MAEQGEAHYRYSYRELSAFCLQISLLLEAAVSLDEGLSITAENAADKKEKDMLLYMTEGVEPGDPFFKVLEDAKVFPDYVVKMAKLGQQTGIMDQMMQSLPQYYDKEYRLIQAIKNAVTCPIMMAVMLLVVLFVLFSRAVSVPNKAYEQLGAQMPPVAVSAIRLGGVSSGGALVVSTLSTVFIGGIWLASKSGKKFDFVERLTSCAKGRSKIVLAMANRRPTVVLALTLRSGMELEKGMEPARELVTNQTVVERIGKCSEQFQMGESYYRSMKDTGLLSGSYIQMIRVGSRSGHLDQIMEGISGDYEEMVGAAIDNMIARFEPTIVVALTVSVGLVLLFVMLPLVGVLLAIGWETEL